jgi:hypothetical protein
MQYPLFATLVLISWAQASGNETPRAETGALPEPPRVRHTAQVLVGGKIHAIILEIPAQLAPADEEDDLPAARRPIRLDANTINNAWLAADNFDRWLFADSRLPKEVQQRWLERVLERKIEVTAWELKLSGPQQAKLRLAGRGDIKRFFDEVEDRRRDFERDRRNYKSGLAALRRLELLELTYLGGPFDDGSLFARTLHKINDDRKAGHR